MPGWTTRAKRRHGGGAGHWEDRKEQLETLAKMIEAEGYHFHRPEMRQMITWLTGHDVRVLPKELWTDFLKRAERQRARLAAMAPLALTLEGAPPQEGVVWPTAGEQ